MNEDEIIQEIPVTCRFYRSEDGEDFAKLEQITPNRATASSIIYRVAQRPDLTQEYPAEWAAFQAGTPQHEAIDGMPLSEMPGLNEARIEQLKGMGVKTVEILAGLNDQVIASLGMGSLDLREQARTLVKAKSSDAKDDQIAAMQQQIADLTAAMKGGQVGAAAPAAPQADLTQQIALGVAAALQGLGLANPGAAPQAAPEGASLATGEPPSAPVEAEPAKPTFRAEHRGFNKWFVMDADDRKAAGPFSKEEAAAEAERLNKDLGHAA